MKRTAVFVDAGYLYAQGSACLQGSKAKRENLKLDYEVLLSILRALARSVQPSAPLLRIYWYDGTSRGPTLDHRTLADLDDVKLRLGFINSVGQQKGVDSLLITDLVELARNGAICDAILIGGDEDLRIGVQIAQSFGVRVHLVGIEPSRGSQSLQLRQEADTKQEITAVEVRSFLKLLSSAAIPPIMISVLPAAPVGAEASPAAVALDTGSGSLLSSLEQGIESVLSRTSPAQMSDLKKALTTSSSVPAIYDGRVLASCRTALGRDLTMEEKKIMRTTFIKRVQAVDA